MIDIHTHLLPGVDDGSPSLKVSRPILERFAREGVTAVVCTPHLLASRAHEAPHERHGQQLEALQRAVPNGPRLLPGWEIMLDIPGADLSSAWLGLGGSQAVLVEFGRGGAPVGAEAELRRLARSGRRPVVAHPDRYLGCTLDDVRAWRRAGALIQCDGTTLTGEGRASRMVLALLESGLVDFLASDNHGDRRSLRAAARWLEANGGDAQLPLLTERNADRILRNLDPLPVPPLRSSLLTRFRQWLRRRPMGR